MIDKKILITGIIIFLILFSVFTFVMYDLYGRNDFTIKNWVTHSENSSTIMAIEFENKINNVELSLYNPSGVLIDKQKITKKTSNVSFILSQTRSISPLTGNYTLVIFRDGNRLAEKKILVEKPRISIDSFNPKWGYNEKDGYYFISSLNISFNNSGDIFEHIWEGKLIIDSTINWGAPNKHWHDLDIWVPPNDVIFYDLPLDLGYITSGNHNISILFTDKNLVDIVLFEKMISTPK